MNLPTAPVVFYLRPGLLFGRQVPLHRILEALGDGHPIEAAGETLNLTDLLAAAIAALARPQGPAPDAERLAVIAVPDDGRFLEEARQRLIDAAVQGGLSPTLLWRPVAALLGMEPALRDDQIAILSGKTVGVISCLEDGVHAARLEVEVETKEDKHYFVPVSKRRQRDLTRVLHRSVEVAG